MDSDEFPGSYVEPSGKMIKTFGADGVSLEEETTPPPPTEGYWHILEEAAKIAKERGATYGDYKLNYDRISAQCKRLGIELSRKDLYKVMIATKLGRLEETPEHEDSWKDLINYICMLLADK